MYNSEVLPYRISKYPNALAVMEAVKETIEKTNDCLFRRTCHSDQGWAYQMKRYTATLKDQDIYQIMSRKGNCLNNYPIGNFFSILKQEMYHGKIYRSFRELKKAIEEYMIYYIDKRIKMKLNGMSPVQFRGKQATLLQNFT